MDIAFPGSQTYLLACFVTVPLLLMVTCVLGRCLSSRGDRKLPCLPRVPILGSLPHLWSPLPPHLLFTKLAHSYGPLFSLYMGPHYTLVVSEVTLAREVLLHKGRDFAGRPKMVTTDLLTRGGKDIAFADYSALWKSHRRLVHASFALFGEGSSKLQTIDAADSLCSDLQAYKGQSVDLGLFLMRAVTNVVCRLVFSSTYSPHDPELQQVMDYNDGIVQTIARGSLVDIFPCLQIFPNKDLAKLRDCVNTRDKLLTKKLEEHKLTLTPGEPRDLLDALLTSQSGPGGESEVTDDHILMIAAEAFGAGVETTSTTLLWTIAYLLHHPEVQDRLHVELDERVGKERRPSLSDRSSLPFLDSVLCEVLRIRPASPILIPHVAMQDTSLGGQAVPKGTRVLVNIWAIHHDPKHWDKPDQFRPDRFLDGTGKKTTPTSYLPFGAGPRVCVGESLARIELFLFFSCLLQRFHFSVPSGASLPNLRGHPGVVLQPQRYTVTLTLRH